MDQTQRPSTHIALALFSALICSISSAFASAAATDRARILKDEIVRMSLDNMTDNSTRAAIRAEIEARLPELISLSPQVTESSIAANSPGSWQQIWSDEADMDPPGAPRRDLAQIYQVVSDQGWGYNFGVRTLPTGAQVTFALSVVASLSGTKQTTEITRAFSRASGLTPGEDLGLIAQQIQDGVSPDFVERAAGRFPNGPIGAKGVLDILFLDSDLKIGRAANVYTGEVELFVMQKVPHSR
jgi:hypothetical protein